MFYVNFDDGLKVDFWVVFEDVVFVLVVVYFFLVELGNMVLFLKWILIVV